MNKLFELLESERPIIPDSDADYDIGYNNGLVMAQAIALKHDFVTVVRCKDCKYGKLDDVIYRKTVDGETNDTTLYCCLYHWDRIERNKGDHFCSYGERKENG